MRCVLGLVFVLFLAVVGASSKCSSSKFPCEDGECIDARLWCDAHEDCFDGSDEKYCKKSGYIGSKDPNKCPSTYFKCNNGPCIPLAGRCDGYKNCEDSSDEKKCETSSTPKSEDSSSLKPPQEPKSTSAIPTTRVGTRQTPVKQDSHETHFSNSDEMQHSVQIVYSNVGPSDFAHQRAAARNWLLSQRRDDFGWGDETPRAVTALYLSDVQQPKKNETDMLMMKQLEVQLSLDMARNGTKSMKLTNLALYVNALSASCKDPKNFYGENLISTLRNGVNAAHKASSFVNPSVYLTLCINNATTYDDTRKIHEMFSNRNAAISRIDIQALALLTSICLFQNSKSVSASMYEGIRRQFLSKVNTNGLPGNVYEASLLAQALQEMKVTKLGLLEFIIEQQQEDGSFGGILATYLVLPAISGRSFLRMNDHCSKRHSTDLAPIEVLKNPKRRKIYVQYSLNYGYPPEITQTIQMQVAEGINFLDVMRLAQEINPKFRFMLDGNREVPIVYSIGGIPNDAEKGMFWTLHLSKNRANAGSLAPFSGNIKELIPHAGDEYIFWMRSI